jgi:hypothetical protein
MNKDRRKALRDIQDQLDNIPSFDDLKGELQDVLDAEQEAYDNMPESLQNGDNGQRMQAALECIQAAIDALDSFELPSVEDAIDG